MQGHRCGKQVILTTGEVTTEAVVAALSYSDDDDGKALVQAAKLIRQYLFNNENEFKFNFDKDSQKNSVPVSLIMLLQIILEGTNVSLLDDNKTRNIAVGLSKLVKVNAIKRKREQSVLHVRHKYSQETPLTVYIGLYIHSKTRKKSMVNKFSLLGLCISSNCVDEIQSVITQNVCQQYRLKETVCPDSLVENLFTATTIDNIDHNETSSRSSSNFHGTSISMFQHYDNLIEKDNITYNFSKADYKKDRNFELPLYYNDISSLSGVKSQFPILTTNEYPKNITVNPVHDSLEWLKFVDETNSTNTKASEKSCNWAAYHQKNIVQ